MRRRRSAPGPRSIGGIALAAGVLCAVASCLAPATAAARIEVSEFTMAALAEGGSAVVQAGVHPLELKTRIALGGAQAEGGLRDLHLSLPPGLIENPAAVERCSETAFRKPRESPFEVSSSGESCPEKSQIGIITIAGSTSGTRTFGLYNLVPATGTPARFGANPYGTPIAFTSHVRSAEGEYGLTVDLSGLPQSLGLESMELEIWGTPWATIHNTERGNCLNEADPGDPWAKCSVGRPVKNPAVAYLTMPPSCTGALTTSIAADSWSAPGRYLPDGEPDPGDPAWATAVTSAGAKLTGCDRLSFAPSVSARLTDPRATSPSGFELVFENDESGLLKPSLPAPSQPRRAVVSLTEGMTLNPSLAAGLEACSSSQFAAETVLSPIGAGCPNASRIGDFTVESPLYGAPIQGSLFLAAPYDNPFRTLLAFYVVAKAPARGIIVKVPGRLDPDPLTGRLTATLENLPQLPYSRFAVKFREGQRSPLLSPSACGSFTTGVALTPWLEASPGVVREPVLTVAQGPEGGPCPNGAAPPFAPTASGGDLNPQAGAFSPFYLHLARGDTEQEFTSYSAELPPGLLAKLAAVAYCPDAALGAAKSKSGAEEEAHPSCPAASLIGHTTAGFGAGSVLAYAPGNLYLAGPYHGAPLSIAAVDSAKVGPFDFGVFVVRSAIGIDPRSARVSIDPDASDPIPHIRDGVPLHLRDLRVYVDRPEFTLNPTSCERFTLSSRMGGAVAPFTGPGTSSTRTVPFQAFDCSSLGYGPKLSLRLGGGTRHGQYPSLRATLTTRADDANTARAQVTLPPSEFLAQNHIGTVCTRPQFEREACPSASVYGRATAVTPLLDAPMTGPVYLRTSTHQLPDLVAVLHGQGIRIVLEGRIDSRHGGLRATFEGIPDAPVTRFTMRLYGGKRGLLVNERNLCSSPQLATARLLGQANLGLVSHPPLEARCKKKKASHKGSKKHGRGGGR
ncbi:MAG TPA: hypothetical protein VMF55_13835 [Solirubrobacterales bacterium]|nr:hypothetical protein [Solirubrobacterales bacterium]